MVRSSGLTVPNGLAQQAVIQAALENAKVDPHQIAYVEAHGTGTPLGDPIEVTALTNVLNVGRSEENALMIGSVKTNIGHLEAAAGIASLIKTVLALQYREIPPHLHFHQLNPHIAAANPGITIPTQLAPWRAINDQPRFAGVSSFGFGGANAHIVLEEAPELPPQKLSTEPIQDRPIHVFNIVGQGAIGLNPVSAKI